jgi:hypothetical protein
MATPAIDYSALARQAGAISSEPAASSSRPAIDYAALAKQAGATDSQPATATPSPTDALSKATGFNTGPNWFARKWDEIKGGLTSAQEGGGLARQPTALGNAAQMAGMVGTEVGQLGSGDGEVASSAENVAANVKNAIPSTQSAAKTFQELKGAIGNHTVAVTDRLADTLAEIKQAVDTGSTLPPVINKFVTRIADVNEGPLTYTEARQFYHNVSELSASEKMAAKAGDLRLIQLFKHALGDTISQTADSAGRLLDYQGAMSGFAKAKQVEDFVDKGKKMAGAAIGSAVLGGTGYAGYKALKDLFGQ